MSIWFRAYGYQGLGAQDNNFMLQAVLKPGIRDLESKRRFAAVNQSNTSGEQMEGEPICAT